jgi:nucleotide-binding universal stress UspA family protein
MTISWTGFANGNKEAAIKMVVFGLVIGALAAPVYTKVVMGATVEVNMLHMFKQIALFVFAPLFAGLATQYLLKKKHGEKVWNQNIKPKFPPFSALGVTLIAFLAMSLKAKNIIANPGDIVVILVPLICFYLLSYILLSVTGKLFFPRGDAIAMVFGVVMRDLSIALAIAMTAFGRQGLTIALLIALAYVIQIQSAAWYVKFVGKIFREKPETADTSVKQIAASPSNKVAADDRFVPTIRKILYATDLSEAALHAVRYACSMGHQYGAEVTVLHVIPDALDDLLVDAGIDLSKQISTEDKIMLNRQEMQSAINTIQNRIHETSRQVKKEIPHCPVSEKHVMVKVGIPVEQILSTAKEGGFDMVIMGTHGHGKLGQALLGSVANEVIQKSPIPVMVVRLPEGEKPLLAKKIQNYTDDENEYDETKVA